MKETILAWLNANGSNEVKAKEIEYQTEVFVLEFINWLMLNCDIDKNDLMYWYYDKQLNKEVLRTNKELLKIFKDETNRTR